MIIACCEGCQDNYNELKAIKLFFNTLCYKSKVQNMSRCLTPALNQKMHLEYVADEVPETSRLGTLTSFLYEICATSTIQ